MLDGILTTALQIIIVLDICGAVFYFLMSGAAKAKEKQSTPSQQSPTPAWSAVTSHQTALQPALATTGATQPPPIPEWVSKGDRSATSIYDLEGTPEAAPEPAGLSARVSTIFASIKAKFQPQNTGENAKPADLNNDRVRLNKVLDSFREDA